MTRATGDDTTDVDLVAAVRRGDDRAFERLYERYHRRIAAYIYGMVDDYGRAEDIAQDVFMSALRRMRETDRAIAFKPWVYEIAKNACIDQFRRGARRSEEVSFDVEDGLSAADPGRHTAPGLSPDAAVDQKMTLDHLCGAFGGLSDTHHQIIVMRELEGLSYREIGERLGMSRPSVESTLFRARRRLTEEYAELMSGERCLRVQAIIIGAVGASPGTRDSRRMAAHISHCQTCRRAAHAAGVDISASRAKTLRTKVAAILPLPPFLRQRLDGTSDLGLAGSQHANQVAQWSAQLGATLDPALVTWVKAAAAAATIAIVGVGAGEGTKQLAEGAQRNGRPVVGKPVVGKPVAAVPAASSRAGSTGPTSTVRALPSLSSPAGAVPAGTVAAKSAGRGKGTGSPAAGAPASAGSTTGATASSPTPGPVVPGAATSVPDVPTAGSPVIPQLGPTDHDPTGPGRPPTGAPVAGLDKGELPVAVPDPAPTAAPATDGVSGAAGAAATAVDNVGGQ